MFAHITAPFLVFPPPWPRGIKFHLFDLFASTVAFSQYLNKEKVQLFERSKVQIVRVFELHFSPTIAEASPKVLLALSPPGEDRDGVFRQSGRNLVLGRVDVAGSPADLRIERTNERSELKQSFFSLFEFVFLSLELPERSESQ